MYYAMLEDVGKPNVGDKIRVALKELEITGIIAEEDNLILTEAAPGRERPLIWVLSEPKLIRLSDGLWLATEWRSFKRT